MLAKKDIYQIVDRLPEHITVEQLEKALDELQFIEDVREGLKDVREGRVFTLEEVREQLLP